MLPLLVGALVLTRPSVAVQGPLARAFVQAPKGKTEFEFLPPRGFESQMRVLGHTEWLRRKARIRIDWGLGFLKDSDGKSLKAFHDGIEAQRKMGHAVKDVTIGKYSGTVLRIPVNKLDTGADFHIALVSGFDMLSISYFDPTVEKKGLPAAQKEFLDMMATGRFSH